MAFAPVPGHGAGHLDIERNFAHWVDSVVLGSHNYVNTKTWDPEGLVSTLPAIASCLLGILAGHVVARAGDSIGRRTVWLVSGGVALLLLGLAIDPVLPINKNIWTSSFALFMAGIDGILFGLIFWLVDGQGIVRPFRPAVILGMNAIAVYMASEVIDVALWKTPMPAPDGSLRVWIYRHWFAPLTTSAYDSSLLYAVTYVLVNFAIAWYLHRRQWYLKV